MTQKLVTHTFGHPADPDVKLAKEIARSCSVEHHHYYDPLPEPAVCIELAEDFALQSILKEPASAGVRFRYYDSIYSAGKIIVDGAFGEVLRRQYYNRLAWVGRNRVLGLSATSLLPFLQTSRVNVFTQEAEARMFHGFEAEVEYLKELLLTTRDMRFEDALDLLAVQTRIPNYGGAEQARMDALGVCYMPFCQPSVFDAGLHAPLGQRRNGELLKTIVRASRPALARYPLAKGGATNPFWFSTAAGILTRRVKGKIGKSFADPITVDFLIHVEEIARDIVGSHSVTSFWMYDVKKIQFILDAFYNGDRTQANQLDWFLGFELWRKAMKLN